LIYEFSFDKSVGNNYQQETVMQISAGSDIMDLKRIFSWDEDDGKWVENISTSRNARDVRLNVKLIGGKFVVLTTKKAMEFGAASWYKYKNCDCAASPDYPKGTRLKVTNLDNNKSLIVKVNDWGPERDKHPERVIDLDKTAFKKLGSLSRGILKNVRVELVKN
jgi:rare lipoprotein A (peptidoglycan hydrolase)